MTHTLTNKAVGGIYRAVTRADFEHELDAGNLFVAMRNGHFWQMRRNGRTQTWKTDAARVRVPYKAGLRATGAITEEDFREGVLKVEFFRHRDDLA